MEAGKQVKIMVEATIHVPVKKVWEYWTEPIHITKWNHASEDWHTPLAENDLRAGGKFLSRMEAKDGSFGFDFSGIYDEIRINEYIAYTLDDGRKVTITFTSHGNDTIVSEIFDAESENPIEMQKSGWEAIVDNFKRYAESLN
ncbi:uncharacterized protein YndB with AHSA1/START domain [Cytobacillus eiseniae]|uniref:Uncharacterized protein YndB with AHSA1/START domain n=1 Tax=Cytobacillus eiseniae TaxID=762947 RepID=A0ABS4RDI9_9BACI|nr:SRPBCC family protein [Cytobacillus eiseniae]MBP2240961.1 uncharacterized protein YndB with AHSA1/START domain [Cytobacillus eiseniae]